MPLDKSGILLGGRQQQMTVAIGVDHVRHHVFTEWPQPVQRVEFTPEEATALAQELLRAAARVAQVRGAANGEIAAKRVT